MAKFNFLKGNWVLGYVSTQIYDFANVSYFPKTLNLKSFGNSWGNSYNQNGFAQYHVSFYLWEIKSLLKQNIMTKIADYYYVNWMYELLQEFSNAWNAWDWRSVPSWLPKMKITKIQLENIPWKNLFLLNSANLSQIFFQRL